jgi:hypothetical protein
MTLFQLLLIYYDPNDESLHHAGLMKDCAFFVIKATQFISLMLAACVQFFIDTNLTMLPMSSWNCRWALLYLA